MNEELIVCAGDKVALQDPLNWRGWNAENLGGQFTITELVPGESYGFGVGVKVTPALQPDHPHGEDVVYDMTHFKLLQPRLEKASHVQAKARELAAQLFHVAQVLLDVARPPRGDGEAQAHVRWAAVIKAWGEGALIEFRYLGLDDDQMNMWRPFRDNEMPNFLNTTMEFRAAGTKS